MEASVGQNTQCTIYVGDLAPSVTEKLLYDRFSEAGSVKSVKLIRAFPAYAFIEFQEKDEGECIHLYAFERSIM